MSLFETLAALLTVLLSWLAPTVDPLPVLETETVAVVESVIDGDTIIVSQAGQEYTVRYIGIDTPEPRREGSPECGSKEATVSNRDLVGGKTVRLVADAEDRDKYDRLLRYVYVGTGEQEIFVNQELIRLGLATPLTIAPNTSHASGFKQEANSAKQAKVGSWSTCSDFE